MTNRHTPELTIARKHGINHLDTDLLETITEFDFTRMPKRNMEKIRPRVEVLQWVESASSLFLGADVGFCFVDCLVNVTRTAAMAERQPSARKLALITDLPSHQHRMGRWVCRLKPTKSKITTYS